jgi:pyridinium-3,5-bisthiocarboxylic acid mononucleotide nickel chelatase
MLLAALLDAGCPLEVVQEAVQACGVDEVSVDVQEVQRAGMRALHLRVSEVPGAKQRERDLDACITALNDSLLPVRVRANATFTLVNLGVSEATLHGTDPDHVHLHELSAADTLVDVVGVCAALDHFDVEHVHFGPLPVGQGTIETEHGTLPLPAPSTMALLTTASATLLPAADGVEHVTPTAAALLTTLGTPGMASMRLRSVGHGAGTRDDPRRPNIARVWIGDAIGAAHDAPLEFDDDCTELRTNIDDASPVVVADVMQRCLAAGALDAWVVPATMKKGRPGSILHVLVPPGSDVQIATMLLEIAPTLGVRRVDTPRMVAERDVVDFESPLGAVRVKRKMLRDRVVDARPELDDCRAVADRTGIPLHRVIDTITAAARAAFTEDSP